MDAKKGESHHHILSYRAAVATGLALFLLTAVTVWVARIDLGPFNFLVAILIAIVKASMVSLFFMGLRWDKLLNGLTFITSFVFLAIFIVLTATDLFFRGNVYVQGPLIAEAKAKSKLTKPWITTPQLVSRGHEVFEQNCVMCHGATGQGNGPAAAALSPKPRNFTSAEGWINGRKPSNVFKTLKEGIKGSAMASFATLPSDDRWALAHYVLSLGPQPPQDTPADLAKIGINPNAPGGGAEVEAPTIPIEVAMEQIAQAEVAHQERQPEQVEELSEAKSMGVSLYKNRCASCHGPQGKGGIEVENLGVNPKAYLVTHGFGPTSEGLKSFEAFRATVSQGLPGNLMPSNGQLSDSEIRALYDTIRQFR